MPFPKQLRYANTLSSHALGTHHRSPPHYSRDVKSGDFSRTGIAACGRMATSLSTSRVIAISRVGVIERFDTTNRCVERWPIFSAASAT